MNNPSVRNRGARHMGAIAVALAATLVALLMAFGAAKPSEAQDPILTINPSSVDLGSVTVGADPATQTIEVTNTGTTALVLGGVEILGVDSGAFTTSIDPTTGLTVLAGESATFTVSFDPVETGLQTAQLTFNSVTDLLGGTVSGVEAPTISLSGQGVSVNPSGSGCTITGGNNSETLRGTPGNDVICALGGNDKVNGLGGKDKIRGGSGKDRLRDKAGRDKLLGQRGRDTLITKDGKRGDVLVGGPRHDKAFKDRGDRARSI